MKKKKVKIRVPSKFLKHAKEGTKMTLYVYLQRFCKEEKEKKKVIVKKRLKVRQENTIH